MHIGYFSSIMGTKSGPSIFDKRTLEATADCDHKNTYTIYGLMEQNTRGLKIPNDNFFIRPIKPSGKWLGIGIGLTLELKRRPVDLLHATYAPPPIVPCRFVMTMTCWSQYDHPEFYPPMIRWRILFLLNRGVKNASAIFCYSEFLKEKLIERFHIDPEKIFITQPGVGEEIKRCQDKEALDSFLRQFGIESPYILFIGTLTMRKNVEGLIRAYHMLLHESKIEQKLVLLGEKGFRSEGIYQTVEELNLSDQIIFIDLRPHHELPLFYSGADVFVFPTLYEGFGLPPLEAMACGTPVVASNVTSVPEVVGNGAVLVDPYRPEDIADGSRKCLTDEKLRIEMIKRGLVRAGEFSWQKAAVQTVSAYEEVYQSRW